MKSEQVNQNGVLQSVYRQLLNMASLKLLLAAPSMLLHALTEPTTDTNDCNPCMPTSRSQHDKALCSLFTHTHRKRTDMRLIVGKPMGEGLGKVGASETRWSFQTQCCPSPVLSRTASVLYTVSAGVTVITDI